MCCCCCCYWCVVLRTCSVRSHWFWLRVLVLVVCVLCLIGGWLNDRNHKGCLTNEDTTITIPNLHLEHHMWLTCIYHWQNYKTYPLLNPTHCPARHTAYYTILLLCYTILYYTILNYTIRYYTIPYHTAVQSYNIIY